MVNQWSLWVSDNSSVIAPAPPVSFENISHFSNIYHFCFFRPRQVAVELWDTVRCVTQVGVRSEVGRFSDSVQAAMIRQAKRFLETR